MSDIEKIREKLDDINVRLALATRVTIGNREILQNLVPKVETPESEAERAGIEIEKLKRGSDSPKLEAARVSLADAGDQFEVAGEAFNTIVESLGRAAELLMKANQEVLDYRQENGL